MKKISILVPIYNAEQWLKTCVDSILAQTFFDYELFLVNDGSTDGSGSICDAYAVQDRRVKVIHQNNKGVSSARNLGLDEATGEYLCFIDADDYVHPEYLSYLLGLIEKYGCDVVQCRHLRSEQFDPALFGVEVDDIVVYTGQQMQWGLCGRNGTRSMLWGKLFKRGLFCDVRFPVGMIHEDEAAMHRVLSNAHRMAFTTSKFYYYRTTQDSIMNKPFSVKRLDAVPILKERMEFYRERSWNMLAYATAQRCCVDIITLYRKVAALPGDTSLERTQLRETYRELWTYLKESPLLSAEATQAHQLWLDDPSQGEIYSCWAEMGRLDDVTIDRFEQTFNANDN